LTPSQLPHYHTPHRANFDPSTERHLFKKNTQEQQI